MPLKMQTDREPGKKNRGIGKERIRGSATQMMRAISGSVRPASRLTLIGISTVLGGGLAVVVSLTAGGCAVIGIGYLLQGSYAQASGILAAYMSIMIPIVISVWILKRRTRRARAAAALARHYRRAIELVSPGDPPC